MFPARSPRAASRSWLAFVLSTLVIAAVLSAAPAASALSCTDIALFSTPPANAPLPGSCFEGWDGNQVDPDGDTPADPDPPNRLDWGSDEVLAGAQKALDYTQGALDSQFTGGSEEVPDSWTWGVGSLGSDKYNLISGYSYSEPDTDDLMLALAFVRESNNGASWLAFELNQEQPGYRTSPLTGAIPPQTLKVPTRSTGDLLITYSVSNNNSPKPVIGLCKWVGDEHTGVWTDMDGVPVASNCPPLNASVAQADLNGADIQAVDNLLGTPSGLLQAGTFGEASINLSEAFKAAGGDPDTEDDCLSFGYFWAHSRSSEPITSAQQDFILPSDAISAANCAVSGTKWHDKDGNGLVDGTDEGVGGWTIYADYDNDGVHDAGEPFDVTAPKDGDDLRDPGTYTITDLVDGTYPIREVGQSSWLCTSPGPIDTDPSATDPTDPGLCGTEVTMTGALVDGVDFLNFQVDPSISLDKTATPQWTGDPVAGDQIEYEFTITNTGNVALTGVDLDDDLLGLTDATCNGVTTLAVGASTVCTELYTLTQADIDAGSVDNDAEACGDPPIGSEVCDPGQTTTSLPAAPDILLEKSASLVTAGAAPVVGDKIAYTFEITNTGNVTLTGVDLDDSLLGYANVTCNGVTELAPGASTTCTADYFLTQADIDAGTVDNDAEACGDAPGGDVEVCDPDDTSTPLTADPSILLEKSGTLVTAGAVPVAGDKVVYTFEITNTGNVTLDGVDLDDSLLNYSDVTCNGVTELAPGASTVCTADYFLTQADINAGTVDNDAEACGDSPANVEVCSPDDTSTPLAADKKILLEKSAALVTAGAVPVVGDKITYTFKITNTGNVTLTGVDLDDSLLGLTDVTCNLVATLLPGGSTTCTYDYFLTQADIDAGKVDNVADACGDPPIGTEVCSTDSTSTPLAADPDILLEKTGVLVKAGAVPVAGDKITYTFKVTNTGNVTLDGVDLDDALLNLSDVTCNGVTELAPGASTTCTTDYVLTQLDINAGDVENFATACGDSPADVEVCSDDDTSTPLAADPSILLEKTAALVTAGAIPVAGDKITYTFEITNTGNVTLDGVDLDDALVGKADATCGGITLLDPGDTTTCTADYTLTQADIDAGKVDNAADACGDSPADVEVCSDDDTSTPLAADPSILLEKSAVLNAPAAPVAGDTITYTFDVTNTGNVTLDGVDLDDALVGKTDATCGDTVLDPGEKTTCTADYTLTQADVDAGKVDNAADACGDSPADVEVCSDDDTSTPLAADPEILLEKSAVLNAPAAPVAGDTITYTFKITNTGNVTLDGVDLDDALVGFSDAVCNAVDTLAPGASTTCTADYTLTQADVDAGKVDNDADACGDSPAGVEVCSPDDTSTPLPADPEIDLEKFATLNTGGDGLQAGDTITYEFVIKNTGNVTLDGVDLDDALVGLSDAVCNAVDTLAPGASTTCTESYTLTQADIDAGKVDNDAEACGDSPAGVEVCDDDDTSTPLDPNKGIQLKKTNVLNAPAAPKPGDTITYTFEITNLGNVTLDGTDLDDALVGKSNAVCGDPILSPNEKTSCTADYTLTQADIDAGSVTNIADACGDAPDDTEVCDDDTTTTDLPADPKISLEKDNVLNTGGDGLQAGDTVTYTFTVTNTGNVTLDGVDLDDDLLGLTDVVCNAVAVLAPGASTICTQDYTLTQADVDAGKVDNVAKACGDSPKDVEVCDEDDTSTPLDPDKAIQLKKTGVLNSPAAPKPGDTITYTFEITNIGNVTLKGVDLDDALVGKSDATCGDTELAPDEVTSCTADYSLTQADIDAGKVDNLADACGDAPDASEVCDDAGTSTPLPADPKIDLEKSGVLNAPAAPKAGDTVTYTFEITNTGNVTLDGVDLDDPRVAKLDATCGDTVLDPGEKTTCTADYTLTQADVDAGEVSNTADACGDSPKDVEVCDEDTAIVQLPRDPKIDLEKTAVLNAPAAPKAGDTITYGFEITNTGNVTLGAVDLDDALVGKTNAVCGKSTLAPGEKTSCTADYTLTQADVDAGKRDNLADACGFGPGEQEVCDDDETSTPLPAAPSIDLEKTGVVNAVTNPKAGDTITYTFTVTNTGNVTLTGADLDDALVGKDNATCGATSLAPGADTSCTADYTITQDDIDAGQVTNTADACADPPVGNEVCDEDTVTTPLDPTKGILVEKDGPATAYHGDDATYTFLVSNTGNVTLTGVTVDDDKCKPATFDSVVTGDADDRLEVGEQWKYTCTTKLGAHADGEANPIVNTVTATGKDPKGATLTDTDTHETKLLHAILQIDKSGPANAEAGQRVAYALVVTNPGDTAFLGEKLSVTDPKCDSMPTLVSKKRGDADDATPDWLDPGDTWTYSCFVQTAAGQTSVTNVAIVTGPDSNNRTASDEDDATTALTQPQIVVLPETIVSGAAKLRGPSKCVNKSFIARVTGKRIKKVVWYVDGKRVKTFTSKTGEATRANFRVNPARYGKGIHRLRARITFSAASRTDARNLRMTFQECAKQVIAPKFTG